MPLSAQDTPPVGVRKVPGRAGMRLTGVPRPAVWSLAALDAAPINLSHLVSRRCGHRAAERWRRRGGGTASGGSLRVHPPAHPPRSCRGFSSSGIESRNRASKLGSGG